MPRCCGGATCSCVIDNGMHIQIIGTGSPSDPFVITGDIALQAQDNTVFDVGLTGLGTTAVPWQLSVNFASTAKLNDLPDVNAPAPTNGQVLGWDTATGQWTNRAPTTAAAGTLTHDTSLAGDGSAGAPLQINEDPARMLATAAAGLGLSDTGMNAVVRKFADSTARAAATPAPVTNALSMLASNPGQIDYWTGTAWSPAGVFVLSMAGNELYQRSGPYTGAQRVTYTVKKVTAITDSDGLFDVIPAVDIASKAGVISATVQVIAADVGSLVTPYAVVVVPSGGAIKGATYRLDDGQPLALSPVSVTVTALVY
jgi:hypothetical protein